MGSMDGLLTNEISPKLKQAHDAIDILRGTARLSDQELDDLGRSVSQLYSEFQQLQEDVESSNDINALLAQGASSS